MDKVKDVVNHPLRCTKCRLDAFWKGIFENIENFAWHISCWPGWNFTPVSLVICL